jgi:hypothetical protein
MLRETAILALFGAVLGAAAQEGSKPKIDRALVERFRLLNPEQKELLRKRLEAVRKLTAEERERLHENLERFRSLPAERQKALRERLEKMTPDERKRMAELATGFFRWMQARYGEVRFPRQPFFRWAAARRPEALEELKGLEPGPRKDAFLKLAHEYREFMIQQLRQHARRHGCVPASQLQELEAEDFGSFWQAAERLARSCPNAPKRPPPVRKP